LGEGTYPGEWGHKVVEKVLGATFRIGPKSLFLILTLWLDSLESSWGNGKYPGQSSHKAVEKAVGATFSVGPKGLFYGLVAKFSRILLVERLGGKYPSQSPIGTEGHRKIPQGHFIKCNVVQKMITRLLVVVGVVST
jgi:hypothetical protein